MTRVAIYARYSSDLQDQVSIDDQVRLCKERAAKEKWEVAEFYSDPEISGWSMILRPGIRALMQDASAGKFDLVLSEAMDRLSRDQADIATIWKRLQFAGVDMFTIAEGKITELHIGMKGTMNALFLKDLALKTHRGLSGRVERGKSGGGISFGYDVVKKFDADGEAIRGDRVINGEQAEIVRRIFQEFSGGRSPKAIAAQLNRDKIPGPRNGPWGQSTINGNRRRGTGILNNDLYVGVLVWNRQRFLKDPDTGKRVPRFNPEEEWIRTEVPELRIVDQELWDKVKARQKVLDARGEDFHVKQRPRYLFSYLLKCGCCNGGFSMISSERYGCSTARNKGTCDNRLTIRQVDVEQAVLNALQNHLMDPRACEVFCEEYRRHLNELQMRRSASLRSHQLELERALKEKDRFVQSIKDGVPATLIKDDLVRVSARCDELKQILDNTEDTPVLIHPRMADRYKKEVAALRAALNDEANRTEAAELLRSLVDKIVLTPKATGKGLSIDLYGDLAGILSIAANQSKAAVESMLALQVGDGPVGVGSSVDSQQDKLVAGGRNRLNLLFPKYPQDKLVAGARNPI